MTPNDRRAIIRACLGLPKVRIGIAGALVCVAIILVMVFN